MFIHAVAPGWWHNITPLDCGYEACVPEHAYGPAVRHYFLLHYVFDGEGTFQKNGVIHNVYAGDLFVICPEDLAVYRADGEDPWKYCWISFRAEETPTFLMEPVIRQPQVRQVFEQIREQVEGVPEDGKIFALLYEMLWRLSLDAPLKQDRQNNYALYAKTYLETAYMRQISIQEIADTLHIDRRYLTALFRETYGKPPQTYLMQLRLEQAKQFLNRGYGVWEAASMAGFSDLSNFSRQYKAYYGISPSRQKAD